MPPSNLVKSFASVYSFGCAAFCVQSFGVWEEAEPAGASLRPCRVFCLLAGKRWRPRRPRADCGQRTEVALRDEQAGAQAARCEQFSSGRPAEHGNSPAGAPQAATGAPGPLVGTPGVPRVRLEPGLLVF